MAAGSANKSSSVRVTFVRALRLTLTFPSIILGPVDGSHSGRRRWLAFVCHVRRHAAGFPEHGRIRAVPREEPQPRESSEGGMSASRLTWFARSISRLNVCHRIHLCLRMNFPSTSGHAWPSRRPHMFCRT